MISHPLVASAHKINRARLPIYLAWSHLSHRSVAGSAKRPQAQRPLLSHKLLKYLRDGREEKFKDVKCQKEKHQTVRLGSFSTQLLDWSDPDIFTSDPPITGFRG